MTKNYPDVALLTMAYDPIATMRAIVGAAHQTYPGRKIIYLLRQKPFPPKITLYRSILNRTIELKQFDILGKWPALWYLKAGKFFRHCDQKLFVWWDEDDRFENAYIEKAIEPALNGRFPLAWTKDMVMVRGNSLNPGQYRSPIGTLAGEVATAKRVFGLVKKTGANAKDCQYRKLLDQKVQVWVHHGVRYYIHHKNSHTTRYTNKSRKPGEDVDA